MRLLALGGSLRPGSRNRALLDEAAVLAPSKTELDRSQLAVIGSLPLFNQDLVERDGVPSAVVELKDALRAADGLLIATPEYNWGIPGFLKNAIDWASRPPSDIPHVFGDLPVALVGAGGLSGTRNAQTAWVAVFRYLKMRPWFGHSLFVDRSWERFDRDNRLTDEATREQLRAAASRTTAHSSPAPAQADGHGSTISTAAGRTRADTSPRGMAGTSMCCERHRSATSHGTPIRWRASPFA